MDVIQEVGSYAGFAAVVGLAVLAALFFSQARDLRRLREWAGRAPERAAEQAATIEAALGQSPQAAAEQPTGEQAAAEAPSGAVKPIPSRKPAAAAAAGAATATAVQTPEKKDGEAKQPTGAPVPATAAASAGQGGPGKPAAAPAGGGKPGEAPGAKQPDAGGKPPAVGKPGPATPAAGPAAAPPKPGTPPAVPAKPGAATPGAPVTPGGPTTPAAGKPPVPAVPRSAPPPARPGVPARPAPVGRTPAPATAQSTAVLPPSARLRGVRSDRDRDRDRSGLEPRYIALIVAGLIVLGGGLAFGVSQLGDDGGGSDTAEGPRADQEQPAAGPLNRSLVTVSVLNGTTVPGLAAQIGDEVESKGFQRGNVANAIDQQRPTSVVLFAEGAERPARVVARSLGISEIEPVDPDSQALAGNASVVVVVGADQTQ